MLFGGGGGIWRLLLLLLLWLLMQRLWLLFADDLHVALVLLSMATSVAVLRVVVGPVAHEHKLGVVARLFHFLAYARAGIRHRVRVRHLLQLLEIYDINKIYFLYFYYSLLVQWLLLFLNLNLNHLKLITVKSWS